MWRHHYYLGVIRLIEMFRFLTLFCLYLSAITILQSVVLLWYSERNQTNTVPLRYFLISAFNPLAWTVIPMLVYAYWKGYRNN